MERERDRESLMQARVSFSFVELSLCYSVTFQDFLIIETRSQFHLCIKLIQVVNKHPDKRHCSMHFTQVI